MISKTGHKRDNFPGESAGGNGSRYDLTWKTKGGDLTVRFVKTEYSPKRADHVLFKNSVTLKEISKVTVDVLRSALGQMQVDERTIDYVLGGT